MNDTQLMQRAVEVAREGMTKGTGGPFGSVIAKEGVVIAEGCNEVFLSKDPTAHAEVVAIRKASKKLNRADLSDCVIYSSGEPCPMCMAAIYWAGIQKVWFANTKEQAAKVGFDDRCIYKELSLPNEFRQIAMIHLPTESAVELFREWDCCIEKANRPQT